MSRYFTRPRATSGWVEDEYYAPEPTLTPPITVDDHVATDTGLLDAAGDAIWRAPNPVGFGKDDEW